MKPITVDLLKKNPDVFFSQLPEEAEKEFHNLLDYFVFKYNLGKKQSQSNLTNGSFKLFENNPIGVEKVHTYKREELHERE